MFNHETLESRRLLSVSVEFNPLAGQLDVVGTGKTNDIRVTMVNTETSSAFDHGTPLNAQRLMQRPGPLLQGVSVYDAGNLIFNSATLHRGRVNNVSVYGNSGADRITTYASNSLTTSQVYSGEGSDEVNATADKASLPQVYSGDGDDFINLLFSDRTLFQAPDAGPGNDNINAFGSKFYEVQKVAPGPDPIIGCDLRIRVLFGGEGNDVINASLEFGEPGGFGYLVLAGSGDDVITGSAYADQLHGEDGNDVIDAGAGDDYLNGGLGDDWICGDDGNDLLDHGGGNDVVDGGDGHDSAYAGKEDQLISIEELM